MIKILKDGKPIKTCEIIYSTVCDKCGCEFEFEVEDFVWMERRINGACAIRCPHCTYEIRGAYQTFNPRKEEV